MDIILGVSLAWHSYSNWRTFRSLDRRLHLAFDLIAHLNSENHRRKREIFALKEGQSGRKEAR